MSHEHDRILILDFGSQFTQLIARRIREEHVYCEIHPATRSLAWIRDWRPTAVILSGGPSSVYDEEVPGTDAALLGALMRAEAPETPVDPVLRLAAVIGPGRARAEQTAERLRLSNRQRFALVHLSAPPLDPCADVPLKDLHRAARELGAPLFQKLLRLSWARRHAGDARALPGEAFQARLAELEHLASKSFPVLGRDALALGVAEGPELGGLLAQVETWWAERGFEPSREACLNRLRELIAAS